MVRDGKAQSVTTIQAKILLDQLPAEADVRTICAILNIKTVQMLLHTE